HTPTGHIVKLDLQSTNTNDWALRGGNRLEGIVPRSIIDLHTLKGKKTRIM
ncbi:unnamed protein product, partial [Musa acuminata subsp. burmannicoides]